MHLLWECNIFQTMILRFKELMRGVNDIYVTEWTPRAYFFSNSSNFILRPENITTLYMKKYIWRSRCEKRRPCEHEFYRILQQYIKAAYTNHAVLGLLPDVI